MAAISIYLLAQIQRGDTIVSMLCEVNAKVGIIFDMLKDVGIFTYLNKLYYYITYKVFQELDAILFYLSPVHKKVC